MNEAPRESWGASAFGYLVVTAVQAASCTARQGLDAQPVPATIEWASPDG